MDLTPPPGFQLILPDFPGFGNSPLATGGLSLSEAAQGLENHLNRQGIDGPIVLGGIYMGGYWAMEFIRQFPHRVARILFVSTRPGSDKPEAKQNRLKMADRVEKEGVSFLPAAMIPGLLGRTSLAKKPGLADRLTDWIQKTNPDAVALAQRAMAERLDQTGLMAGLKAKTWVVAGLEDALIPSTEAETMAKSHRRKPTSPSGRRRPLGPAGRSGRIPKNPRRVPGRTGPLKLNAGTMPGSWPQRQSSK